MQGSLGCHSVGGTVLAWNYPHQEQVSSRKVIWDRGKQLSQSHSVVSMVCGEKGLQTDTTLGCGFPASPPPPPP